MVSPDLLKTFQIFRDVPLASLEKLSCNIRSQSYAAGEVICTEGQSHPCLFLIAKGHPAVKKKTYQGAGEKVVARLEPGEFFGEMAFLQGLSYSATVEARDPAEVLILERAALDELIKENPKLAIDALLTVASGLSNRLRSTTRELVSVYEIARTVALEPMVTELAQRVAVQLQGDFGADTTVGFYRWNMFNDEFTLMHGIGPLSAVLPPETSTQKPPSFQSGRSIFSLIQIGDRSLGFIILHKNNPEPFEAGEQQMIQTITAILAPAMVSAEHREEAAARVKFEQSKQRGYLS